MITTYIQAFTRATTAGINAWVCKSHQFNDALGTSSQYLQATTIHESEDDAEATEDAHLVASDEVLNSIWGQ